MFQEIGPWSSRIKVSSIFFVPTTSLENKLSLPDRSLPWNEEEELGSNAFATAQNEWKMQTSSTHVAEKNESGQLEGKWPGS